LKYNELIKRLHPRKIIQKNTMIALLEIAYWKASLFTYVVCGIFSVAHRILASNMTPLLKTTSKSRKSGTRIARIWVILKTKRRKTNWISWFLTYPTGVLNTQLKEILNG